MKRVVSLVVTAALLVVATPALSGAQGTPRPGAPCPRAGMSYQLGDKTLVCAKRKGKLTWVVQTGGGGAGGGVGDIRDQKPPTNGVWKVQPGFPTDLPPQGWRGEPSWFQSSWEVVTTQPVGRRCPSATPLTHLATDLGDIQAIVPQGYMQPGSHATPVPHMYYNTVRENGVDSRGFATVTRKARVYAPADMILRGVATSITSSEGRARTEYVMSFSVCGTLWFFTSHITDVAPQILSSLDRAPRRECGPSSVAGTEACIYSYLSLPLTAGDEIGRSSGYAHGFDFGLADASAPVPGKLDPGAFAPRWSTSRCHLDYYATTLRAQLADLLEGDNGCGQLVSDVAGTASGVWTAVGQRANTYREDLHVALARHWSDRSARVISIGWEANVPGAPGGRYVFSPGSSGSDPDFSTVRPGVVACYDHLSLSATRSAVSTVPAIYISMTSGPVESLRIAGAPGPCPADPSMPADYQTFERRNTAG